MRSSFEDFDATNPTVTMVPDLDARFKTKNVLEKQMYEKSTKLPSCEKCATLVTIR